MGLPSLPSNQGSQAHVSNQQGRGKGDEEIRLIGICDPKINKGSTVGKKTAEPGQRRCWGVGWVVGIVLTPCPRSTRPSPQISTAFQRTSKLAVMECEVIPNATNAQQTNNRSFPRIVLCLGLC